MKDTVFDHQIFREIVSEFPQLRKAFEKFASNPDWEGIETARQKGFLTARQYARDLIAIFCSVPDINQRDQVAEKIYKTLV